MFCAECGTKNEVGAQFCESCGQKLENEVVTTATTVAPKESKSFSTKFKEMSTKNKIIAVVSTLVVVALVVLYFVLGNMTKPEVIAEKLTHYKATNIVVDPVMVATSGSSLMESDAVQTLIKKLLPISTLVTPNIPEAEILSNMSIKNKDDMVAAAQYISNCYNCSVLVKGGHSINDANDLLYSNDKATWFEGKRIDNPNTHGTGCTLSSAIASNLAKGLPLAESVAKAKDYISGALSAMLDLGKGSGPMQHNFVLNNLDTVEEK